MCDGRVRCEEQVLPLAVHFSLHGRLEPTGRCRSAIVSAVEVHFVPRRYRFPKPLLC